MGVVATSVSKGMSGEKEIRSWSHIRRDGEEEKLKEDHL